MYVSVAGNIIYYPDINIHVDIVDTIQPVFATRTKFTWDVSIIHYESIVRLLTDYVCK